MSAKRNLKDKIELMKLQCKQFKLIGISHIGIEDEHYPTPTFLDFIKNDEMYVRSTLGLNDCVKLDLSVFKDGALSRGVELMDISHQIRGIKDYAPGVLLKISLPEIKAAEGDSMMTSYERSKVAFIYAETYEEALYQSGEFADFYVKLALSFDKLAYEDGNLLSSTLKPSGAGNTLINRIAKLFKK
jgi:hypothetical protein